MEDPDAGPPATAAVAGPTAGGRCRSRPMTPGVEARRRVGSRVGRAGLDDPGRRSSSEQCTAAQRPAPDHDRTVRSSSSHSARTSRRPPRRPAARPPSARRLRAHRRRRPGRPSRNQTGRGQGVDVLRAPQRGAATRALGRSPSMSLAAAYGAAAHGLGQHQPDDFAEREGAPARQQPPSLVLVLLVGGRPGSRRSDPESGFPAPQCHRRRPVTGPPPRPAPGPFPRWAATAPDQAIPAARRGPCAPRASQEQGNWAPAVATVEIPLVATEVSTPLKSPGREPAEGAGGGGRRQPVRTSRGARPANGERPGPRAGAPVCRASASRCGGRSPTMGGTRPAVRKRAVRAGPGRLGSWRSTTSEERRRGAGAVDAQPPHHRRRLPARATRTVRPRSEGDLAASTNARAAPPHVSQQVGEWERGRRPGRLVHRSQLRARPSTWPWTPPGRDGLEGQPGRTRRPFGLQGAGGGRPRSVPT